MRVTAVPVSFIKTELTVFACGWALRVSAVRVHTGNKKINVLQLYRNGLPLTPPRQKYSRAYMRRPHLRRVCR